MLTESFERIYAKLTADLGSTLIAWLQDETVDEILVNPDGQCWVDSRQQGLQLMGVMPERQIAAIIHAVAGIHQKIVNSQSPYLEATLPFYQALRGERFTAQIPPIVSKPCFTLRKATHHVMCLADYVSCGRLSVRQASVLEVLIRERKNIVVCGGPGSGKTTLTNALIQCAVEHDCQQRFILVEDVPELRCAATNQVAYVTQDGIDMNTLLRLSLRMRPDRVIIGEVRGREALTLLKAWNTGCPGGISTLHANDAPAALQRLVDLTLEAGLQQAPIRLILQTIDVVVSVGRQGQQKGFVQEIVALSDYKEGKFNVETLA